VTMPVSATAMIGRQYDDRVAGELRTRFDELQHSAQKPIDLSNGPHVGIGASQVEIIDVPCMIGVAQVQEGIVPRIFGHLANELVDEILRLLLVYEVI